jgi:EAL domain-containing protein (putative c-di-GMP-specific phosphodiesterase class I)
MDNTACVLSMLHRLRAMGVKIAMDDFGKGYSSLSSLQTFPFDKIKIDRDFISNLGPNKNSAAIVRAVIDLGGHLKVPVIAEGVETREQLAILANKGCTEVQGYLIGYPLTIDHYSDIIAPSRSATRLICHEGGASKASLEPARGHRLWNARGRARGSRPLRLVAST